MKKVSVKKLLFIALTIFWMSFIFYMSSKDAVASTEYSVGLGMKICSLVYPGFEDLAEDEQFDIAVKYDFFVRKGAHCAEYMILAVLFCLVFLPGNIWDGADKGRFSIFLAFVFTVLYAISDEIHQYFVPGRACQLRDVFIDSAGALLGCVIIYIICLGLNRYKRT